MNFLQSNDQTSKISAVVLSAIPNFDKIVQRYDLTTLSSYPLSVWCKIQDTQHEIFSLEGFFSIYDQGADHHYAECDWTYVRKERSMKSNHPLFEQKYETEEIENCCFNFARSFLRRNWVHRKPTRSSLRWLSHALKSLKEMCIETRNTLRLSSRGTLLSSIAWVAFTCETKTKTHTKAILYQFRYHECKSLNITETRTSIFCFHMYVHKQWFMHQKENQVLALRKKSESFRKFSVSWDLM